MPQLRLPLTALAALLSAGTAQAQTSLAVSTAPTAPVAPPPGKAFTKPMLGSPFSDHAVFQRDVPLIVWGWAPPRTGIAVTFAGATSKARADRSGRWEAKLPAHAAGGPFTLYATGSDGRDVQLSDIMVGDVWLCSGQSNMQFPLHEASWDQSVVQGANDKDLRLLFVPVAAADTPAERFDKPAAWQITSPATASDFSAACFLMGRNLARAEHVTVGLIDASRGGSAASAWVSAEALKKVGGFDAELSLLKLHAKAPARAEDALKLQMDDWWARRAGNDAPAGVDYDDSSWPAADITKPWELWGVPALADFDGVVWYRLAVDLTPDQVKGAAILSFGSIDDYDVTYVNGEEVGSTRGFDTARAYRLHDGLLRPGRNVVAVRVLDTGSNGGLYGTQPPTITFADGTVLPLDGSWRYQQGAPLSQIGQAPTMPWDGVKGLATLYNGMIAPLEDYGLKGTAWYQGETDVGADRTYARLLPGLVADWRDRFGAQPWVVVQLAGFGPPASAPADPAIARLREVQRTVAAADPKVALATAVDIGEPADIHPHQKAELARRMAIAARQVAYGEAIDGSGPVPVSAAQADGIVSVLLDAKGRALSVRGGLDPTGFELCDAQRRCRFAEATLDGNTIRIPAAEPAAFVRYLWAESPVVDLYDANGLPALPFELPVAQPPAPPPAPPAPAAAAPAAEAPAGGEPDVPGPAPRPAEGTPGG